MTASTASASSVSVGESRIRRWGLIWLSVVALVTTAGTLGYVLFFGWSIGDGLYMTAITLTTIGYGDAYPITTLGKVMGGITALMGVGIVALPTAILGAGFMERLREKREDAKAQERCPHCGKLVHGEEGSVSVAVTGPLQRPERNANDRIRETGPR